MTEQILTRILDQLERLSKKVDELNRTIERKNVK